jgi:hypothetical protein
VLRGETVGLVVGVLVGDVDADGDREEREQTESGGHGVERGAEADGDGDAERVDGDDEEQLGGTAHPPDGEGPAGGGQFVG